MRVAAVLEPRGQREESNNILHRHILMSAPVEEGQSRRSNSRVLRVDRHRVGETRHQRGKCDLTACLSAPLAEDECGGEVALEGLYFAREQSGGAVERGSDGGTNGVPMGFGWASVRPVDCGCSYLLHRLISGGFVVADDGYGNRRE